jgi:transposase
METISSITPVNVGSAPLIAAIIDRMGIVERIDRMLPDDHTYKLSVGTRIKAILINILTYRKALYRISEWYSHQDTELLLGQGVTPELLNDDALGRALDALERVGLDTIYTQVAMGALDTTNIPLDFIHFDTSTLSFYGAYEGEGGEEELKIVHGYSKDHRPDLKQIHFGLGTAQGLPIWADVHDGNQSDKKWNLETLQKVSDPFSPEELKRVTYVGDSALVTKENLREIHRHGLKFISRLPETYALVDSLKRRAFEKNEWEEIGSLNNKKSAATYRVQNFRGELDSHKYRFVVVQSSSLHAAKEKKLQKQLEREKIDWTKDATTEEKIAYSCEADARRSLETWKKNHVGFHRVEAETVREEIIPKRGRRGRPKKEEIPPAPVTVYRNQIRILPPPEEEYEELRLRESTFILITNHRDDARLSDEDILRGYKDQYQVEQRFRFLKSPYFVGPVYLHSINRVEAFGYVMLMAVLVYSVLERLIREAMKEETEPLILPGKRKSFKPTALSILDLLEYVLVLQIRMQDQLLRVLPENTEKQLDRILSLLDLDRGIFTQIPPTT